MAEAVLGFGDKACEWYRMINPIEHSRTREAVNKYKVEPYVISADIYGANNLSGRGGWTWYTGSASWYYKVGVEYILGLKIKKKKLSIEPCIPKNWKEFKMKYKFEDNVYNITVKNPNSKNTGITQFLLNGEIQNEKVITLSGKDKINNIEIIM